MLTCSLSLFSENSSGCFQPGGHEGFVARLHTLISVSLGSRGLGEKFHGRVPWPGGESPGLCLSPALRLWTQLLRTPSLTDAWVCV